MQKIFGYASLYNYEEKVNFAQLKKAFGNNFEVYNGVGSLNSNNNCKTLDILLDALIDNYHLLKISKVDDISIYITLAYKEQANWSVSPEQMNKLSFLNAVLCVTAYEASDE